MNRCDESEALLKHYPREFLLFTMIAMRARREPTDRPVRLEPGEALIGKGDFEHWGYSHKQFRTSIKRLKEWRWVGTRRAPKGTIAKVINSDIFDLNLEGEGAARAQGGHSEGIEKTPNKESKNQELRTKNDLQEMHNVHHPLPSASQMDGMMNMAPAALPGTAPKGHQEEGVPGDVIQIDDPELLEFFRRLNENKPGRSGGDGCPSEGSTRRFPQNESNPRPGLNAGAQAFIAPGYHDIRAFIDEAMRDAEMA